MLRNNKLLLATGFKGMGKTFSTMILLRKYVLGNPSQGIFPRQVLIFDVNDEYDEFQVRAIHVKETALFSVQKKFDIRRIRPFMDQETYNKIYPQNINGIKIPAGQWIRMNTEHQLAMLGYLLENFKYGLLLIEDINKYVGDSMPQDLTGTICTNRHANCDIIMHYQSAGRPLPKIWQNADEVRFHHQTDEVDKGKLKDSYELFKIAQLCVDIEFEKGNVRFYVWINKITGKIIGNFTKEMFLYAIKEYIATHPAKLAPLLIRRDEVGKKVYTYPQAENIMSIKLFNKFWGN
jgi:hypothetical protein